MSAGRTASDDPVRAAGERVGHRRGSGRPDPRAPRLWGGKRLGVGGVEDLNSRLVVTVERRDGAAAVPQAEVVVRRVGKPDSDLVEIDPYALAGMVRLSLVRLAYS